MNGLPTINLYLEKNSLIELFYRRTFSNNTAIRFSVHSCVYLLNDHMNIILVLNSFLI